MSQIDPKAAVRWCAGLVLMLAVAIGISAAVRAAGAPWLVSVTAGIIIARVIERMWQRGRPERSGQRRAT